MGGKKRVVITGVGLVSCFGKDPKKFYDSLLAGESGVKEITSFDTTGYPTRFAASVADFNPEEFLEKKLARRSGASIAYAISAGKMAVSDAKLDLNTLNLDRCGVLVGTGIGGMDVFTGQVEQLMKNGCGRVSPFFIPYTITNMAGALLAIDIGFKGPNYSISTACATSNYCIKAAADHILAGDADLILAGGVEASICPVSVAGFSSLRALSRNNEDMKGASKPWDKKRDGFVLGEGCAVFVLESLEHALKRGAHILAEYRGGAINCDAHHMTEPNPDGSGVAKCIELALASSGVKPEEIDYINAHATATPVGDLCEIRAVKKVFGPHLSRIKMNSTKSLIGHALGAAGALELLVAIKAIETGMVHPTINLDDPEEELEGIDTVRGQAQKHNVRVAISNSFGFGGHNSAVVVSKYEQ